MTLLVFWTTHALAGQRGAVAYVNPLIGTQTSSIACGGTIPFVAPPFGMTDWTPQNRQNKISVTSYNYDDSAISGFIGTHQPAIWMGDYGYVTLMPEVGPLRVSPHDRRLAFRHSPEVARPDYYSVSLESVSRQSIRAEMTATSRCAIFRFHFPETGTARVLVKASRPGIRGYATVDLPHGEIFGYNPDRMDAHLGPTALPHFKRYFVVQFQSAPVLAKRFGDDSNSSGYRGGVHGVPPGRDCAGARGNIVSQRRTGTGELEREIPQWDFDATQSQLRAAWNDKLSRLEVTGASMPEMSRLYTALYRALLGSGANRCCSGIE